MAHRPIIGTSCLCEQWSITTLTAHWNCPLCRIKLFLTHCCANGKSVTVRHSDYQTPPISSKRAQKVTQSKWWIFFYLINGVSLFSLFVVIYVYGSPNALCAIIRDLFSYSYGPSVLGIHANLDINDINSTGKTVFQNSFSLFTTKTEHDMTTAVTITLF